MMEKSQLISTLSWPAQDNYNFVYLTEVWTVVFDNLYRVKKYLTEHAVGEVGNVAKSVLSMLIFGNGIWIYFPWDDLIKEIRLPNNVTKAAELEAPLSQYFIKVFLYNSLFFNDLDS